MKTMKGIYAIILVVFLLLIFGCSTTVPENNNHAPEISSSPVTNLLIGAGYSYNVEASDPDGDSLTFSLETNPTGMTINATTGEISWNPGSVGTYAVSVKVSDGELFDIQSFTVMVSFELVIILSPPANVSATDSLIGKVQITWDTVVGASHYQVYRADSLIGTKTPISGWQTETSYDDTSIIPGTNYWYWVKAAKGDSGEEASSFSDYDTGKSLILSLILASPTGVSASDGFVGKVQVSWNPVSGATHYYVYRATSLLGIKMTLSGWISNTTYDDTSASPGKTYWYWVKAATSSIGENASDYSGFDTGYALGFTPLLQPPTNVSATDGMYSDRVEITWDAVSGATHYRVFRSSPLSPGSKTAISDWQSGTSFNDTTGSTGITYYYSVKAATSSSGDNESDFSVSDPGFTSFSYL